MKLFLVLLAVGLATSDITCPPALSLDPCAIKGGHIRSGLIDSSHGYLGGQDIAGDIPPAIAPGGSIGGFEGLAGPYSGVYPGGPDLSGAYSAGDFPTYSSAPALCARHRIVSRVRPVVDECISNVPLVKKFIRNREEIVTRQVPVVTKHISTKEEKSVRHVPVIKKNARTVIEHQTHHVPIVKSRVVPVVQHYTQHVPITRRYTRPVVDEELTHVPVVERRCRPFITEHVQHVPVTERRTRPFVETKVVNIPVKEKFIRNLVEQRIQKSCEPCQPCNFPAYPGFGPYPIGSSYPSVSEIFGAESALTPISVPSSDSRTILADAKVASGHHPSCCTCFCQ